MNPTTHKAIPGTNEHTPFMRICLKIVDTSTVTGAINDSKSFFRNSTIIEVATFPSAPAVIRINPTIIAGIEM